MGAEKISQQTVFYNKRDADNYLSTYSIHPFTIDGVKYETVEHYYQSKKFVGKAIQQFVSKSSTAEEAVMLGQSKLFVKSYEFETDKKKNDTMSEALYAKYSQHERLRDMLLATGNSLIINKSSHSYWGLGGRSAGRNNLGLLLMRTRDRLRKELKDGRS